MVAYRLDEHDNEATYRLIMSLVVPRPIAWVSSYHESGNTNVAPYACFSVVSTDPYILQFTSMQPKDSLRNAQTQKAFCINLARANQQPWLNQTAVALPADQSEAELAGLTMIPCDTVNAPRIAEAVASFECSLYGTQQVGQGTMTFGEVKCVHYPDGLVDNQYLADLIKLSPLSKLGGSEWGRTVKL